MLTVAKVVFPTARQSAQPRQLCFIQDLLLHFKLTSATPEQKAWQAGPGNVVVADIVVRVVVDPVCVVVDRVVVSVLVDVSERVVVDPVCVVVDVVAVVVDPVCVVLLCVVVVVPVLDVVFVVVDPVCVVVLEVAVVVDPV